MHIDLSRLEIREILRVIDGTDIEPEVAEKLRAAIDAKKPTYVFGHDYDHDKARTLIAATYQPTATPTETQRIAQDVLSAHRVNDALRLESKMDDNEPPQIEKLVWSQELQDEYKRKVQWAITPEDVDHINIERQTVTTAQWRARKAYKPTYDTEGNGVINAVFATDMPRAPGYRERFEVGDKSPGGDACVQAGTYTTAAFACKDGHGYTLNGTNAGCPACFMAGSTGGGAAQRADDPGRIDGEDSEW